VCYMPRDQDSACRKLQGWSSTIAWWKSRRRRDARSSPVPDHTDINLPLYRWYPGDLQSSVFV
jgi:hypothetical protein